jgi:hypothetical protein
MNVLVLAAGVFVTLLMLGALGLLFYGAILDGRPAERELRPVPAVIPFDRQGDAA